MIFIDKTYRCKTFGQRHFVIKITVATELWWTKGIDGVKRTPIIAINREEDAELKLYCLFIFGLAVVVGTVAP